jgi:iron(III) transport system permease protein
VAGLLCRLAAAGPAGIVAGVALALMETLADYGTVAYFAVNTFTSGILPGLVLPRRPGCRRPAGRHAARLCPFPADHGAHLARPGRYHNTTGRNRPMAGARLRGAAAVLAVLACLLPLLLGFLLPAACFSRWR